MSPYYDRRHCDTDDFLLRMHEVRWNMLGKEKNKLVLFSLITKFTKFSTFIYLEGCYVRGKKNTKKQKTHGNLPMILIKECWQTEGSVWQSKCCQIISMFIIDGFVKLNCVALWWHKNKVTKKPLSGDRTGSGSHLYLEQKFLWWWTCSLSVPSSDSYQSHVANGPSN